MKNLLLGVALGLGLAAPAGAGYVFYYQVLGDWTVICWREMATREKACRLRPRLLPWIERGRRMSYWYMNTHPTPSRWR